MLATGDVVRDHIETRLERLRCIGGQPPTIFVQSMMTTQNKAKPRVCRTPGFPNRSSRIPRRRSVDTRSTDEEPATDVALSNIQWIADKELALVSQDLRRLKRIGRQRERQGDDFGSGNLAYQLRQIVADIQVLVRGTSRVQSGN